MTLTSSARRQDQPVQIGGQHGYRIEGERAFINAELSVPPYHPGGAWALELWASEYAYDGGELSGVKIAEIAVDLPTPIAPHTHRVDVEVLAQLPLQGYAHNMSLALVELNDGRRVHDVASYPELETFPAPYFQGDVGYVLQGHEVLLQADGVFNPRVWGNLSGTLALELWASDGSSRHCVAGAQLAPLAGQEGAQWLQCRALFSEPPVGQWQLQLALREWTQAYGYVTRDQRDFAASYIVDAPFVEEPVLAAAPAAVAVAAPAAAVPAVAAAKVAAPVAAPKAVAVEAAAPKGAAAVAAVAVVAAVAPKAAVTPAPVAAAPAAVAPVAVAPVAAPAAKPAAPVAAAPVAAAPVAAPAAKPVVPVVAAAPVAAAIPVVAAAPVAAATPVVAAAPVAAAPVAEAAAAATPARSRQVSVQTASAEELARVKGLNLRIAKEIIKARPFAALEDVLKVEGVGRKTFDKIRSLLTL